MAAPDLLVELELLVLLVLQDLLVLLELLDLLILLVAVMMVQGAGCSLSWSSCRG